MFVFEILFIQRYTMTDGGIFEKLLRPDDRQLQRTIQMIHCP